MRRTLLICLVACIVATGLTTTGAVADRLITGRDVRDGSLTGADIKNGSISGTDLSPDLISKIRAGLVNPKPVVVPPDEDSLRGLQHVRKSFGVSGSGQSTLTVDCPGGTFPIAGGVELVSPNDFDGRVLSSYPTSTGTGWTVRFEPGGQQQDLYVHVFCTPVQAKS